MGYIENLPTELLDMVIDNMERMNLTYRTLSPLTRTCRRLYFYFVPHLYRSIRIGLHLYDGIHSRNIVKLVRTLLRNSSIRPLPCEDNLNDLALYVESISIVEPLVGCQDQFDRCNWLSEADRSMLYHEALNLLLPSNGYMKPQQRSKTTLEGSIDYYFLALLMRCKNLHNFSCNWESYQEPSWILETFFELHGVPCLKVLRLWGDHSGEASFRSRRISRFDYSEFGIPLLSGRCKELLNPARWLYCNLANLSKLVINIESGGPNTLDLLLRRTPCLKDLEWTGRLTCPDEDCSSHPSRGASTFNVLRRVANTLQTLRLEIYVSRRDLSICPNLIVNDGLKQLSKLNKLWICVSSLALLTKYPPRQFFEILPTSLRSLSIENDIFGLPTAPSWLSEKLEAYLTDMESSTTTIGSSLTELFVCPSLLRNLDFDSTIQALCDRKSIHLECLYDDTTKEEILELPRSAIRGLERDVNRLALTCEELIEEIESEWEEATDCWGFEP